MKSIYEAVGGDEGLLRLASAWHARVLQDEVVSHAFSHGFHPQHTERLAAYWGEALGGPATYSTRYGDETSVVRMHSGNGVHEEMDQRAIACFDQALEDIGLARDERLRRVLHDYFAWATTTTMARYHHSADDVPNGLCIAKWSWQGLESGGETESRRVRRAQIGDEAVMRDLRLRAMLDSPDAFGSTYERELARTTSDWQEWLSPGVTFILEVAEGARGIVAGVRDATDSDVVHLMAMWVDPAFRGSGGADELAGCIVSWAASEGARTIRLEVMKANERARRFYERSGFRECSDAVVPERGGLSKIRMERAVK